MEAKANLFAALVKAQHSVRPVEKDSKNSYHQYKYASSEDVISEARSALSNNGLAFAVTAYRISHGETGMMLHASYVLAHLSGECLEVQSETPIIPEKGRPEDKATAAAETYNLAYTLRGLLLIERVEEGVNADARDDSKYDPKTKPAERPRAAEVQEEARAREEKPSPSPSHKRKVWERIQALREDLGNGEFARIVGCTPDEGEKWKPANEGEAHTKLARLEAALAERMAQKRATA
jgi:hypothetical protein